VACAVATISATTRATSRAANSCCAINGGSDVALPMPEPNNAIASQISAI